MKPTSTLTETTTKQSRHAATLARLRSYIHAAGHRAPGYRARLNLATIRDRKATAARLERTKARQLPPAPPEIMPAVYGIDWSEAA